jgi:hypothetical protein
MSLTKLVAVREWVSAWKTVWQQKTFALASALLDLVFLISFGFLTAPVLGKLQQHVIIIGSLVSRQLQVPAGRARPAVIDTLFQPPASAYVWQFLGLLLVLALIMFLLYSIVQGLNWWLALGAAGHAKDWKQFLLGFARVNTLWFVLVLLWFCIDTVLDLRRLLVEKATGVAAGGAGTVASVVLLIILYFALASYPLLSARKAFRLGVRKAKVLVPAGVIIAAHFFAGNSIVRWLQGINTTLMFLVGAVLLFALLAWARVYIARVVAGEAHGV